MLFLETLHWNINECLDYKFKNHQGELVLWYDRFCSSSSCLEVDSPIFQEQCQYTESIQFEIVLFYELGQSNLPSNPMTC